MDTKLSIIAEKIATKVAGAAPAHTERELKQRTDAFEKALKRLPEKLQKRQAKRSDKPRR
jgi:ABC-type Zn2+ transport system substrate-binding protein/surface adhesin